jgi:murein DD-endopeptidase MepM/ murein hydrolase activator NlpD
LAQETLFGIARIHGVTWERLAHVNGLTMPYALRPGQVLKLPDRKPMTVSIQQQQAPTDTARPEGRGGKRLAWPVRGVLYARFGRKGKEPHDGVDLAAPLGTPIQTAAAGTVLYAGEQKGYGLIAIVEHPDGLVTLYAHNRDLRVKTGQRVRDGQVIATVGESGRTSGPHLHFEVRSDGRPVDPLLYLQPLAPERLARRAPPRQ